MPRWSVATQALVTAALNAGDVLPIAIVRVAPPLLASAPRPGSAFFLSLASSKPHVVALSTLPPPEPTCGSQSSACVARAAARARPSLPSSTSDVF